VHRIGIVRHVRDSGEGQASDRVELKSGKKVAGAGPGLGLGLGPGRMDIHSTRGILDNRALVGDEG
jgi:hypothetical protein